MPALGYTTRNYNLEHVKQDPILHLAQIVGLDSEISFIRTHSIKVLPILSGLIVYRQLSHIDKQKILKSAQDLNSPRLFGKIQ